MSFIKKIILILTFSFILLFDIIAQEPVYLDSVITAVENFSKMSEQFDKLKCRLADEKSFYAFFLDEQKTFTYSFEKNMDYFILASSTNASVLDVRVTDTKTQEDILQSTSNKTYLKYNGDKVVDANICIECENKSDNEIAIIMILVRDKYSIALPFDDIIDTLRNMKDSNACYRNVLTKQLPFCLVGGTIEAESSFNVILPSLLNQETAFGLGKSKTVTTSSLVLYRGSGIFERSRGSDVLGFRADLSKNASYQIYCKNTSSIAYEHGILLLAIFDK